MSSFFQFRAVSLEAALCQIGLFKHIILYMKRKHLILYMKRSEFRIKENALLSPQ